MGVAECCDGVGAEVSNVCRGVCRDRYGCWDFAFGCGGAAGGGVGAMCDGTGLLCRKDLETQSSCGIGRYLTSF